MKVSRIAAYKGFELTHPQDTGVGMIHVFTSEQPSIKTELFELDFDGKEVAIKDLTQPNDVQYFGRDQNIKGRILLEILPCGYTTDEGHRAVRYPCSSKLPPVGCASRITLSDEGDVRWEIVSGEMTSELAALQ